MTDTITEIRPGADAAVEAALSATGRRPAADGADPVTGYTAALEVNEAVIWATARGSEWWNLWRIRMEPVGRITIITAGLGGDLVHVACDTKEDAEWLRDHMISFAGVPKAAVRVRRGTP